MAVRLTEDQKIRVLNADDLFRIMQQVLLREKKIDRNKEHFWLVCLALNNQVLMIELISLGSVKTIVVEPMDVFGFALQKRAVKLIIVHNHPGGELKPSKADLKLTEKMMAIGRFLETPIVDHLIISEKAFYSFEVSGLMKKIESETDIDLTFKKQEAHEKQLFDYKIKAAKKLLKKAVPIETIVSTIGLDTDEVEHLFPKRKK